MPTSSLKLKPKWARTGQLMWILFVNSGGQDGFGQMGAAPAINEPDVTPLGNAIERRASNDG
ncbi:hypothetical protein N7539_003207 [Penicillium diatomitis]|uniref:Uncharacterized protein n=1 Tax=Penicillium diatomitis TaxID=2819901 RepID=A0A9W9XG45_9EURO|nr:uncharacterized protein N7539_003207 [Penicillium diatomitis]KAJ5491640.1 hypothetical protein N7539_003207 [Penicillium diatomitis]